MEGTDSNSSFEKQISFDNSGKSDFEENKELLEGDNNGFKIESNEENSSTRKMEIEGIKNIINSENTSNLFQNSQKINNSLNLNAQLKKAEFENGNPYYSQTSETIEEPLIFSQKYSLFDQNLKKGRLSQEKFTNGFKIDEFKKKKLSKTKNKDENSKYNIENNVKKFEKELNKIIMSVDVHNKGKINFLDFENLIKILSHFETQSIEMDEISFINCFWEIVKDNDNIADTDTIFDLLMILYLTKNLNISTTLQLLSEHINKIEDRESRKIENRSVKGLKDFIFQFRKIMLTNNLNSDLLKSLEFINVL